jgi:hypothetical protein
MAHRKVVKMVDMTMTHLHSRKTRLFAIVGLLVLWPSTQIVEAHHITLEDLNSRVRIDPHSSPGLYEYRIDSTLRNGRLVENDHITNQWYWWRTGATSPEQPLGIATGLFTDNEATADRNGRPGADFVSLSYRNSSNTIRADLTYELTGGPLNSNTSTLVQTIQIQNTGADVLDFHLSSERLPNTALPCRLASYIGKE